MDEGEIKKRVKVNFEIDWDLHSKVLQVNLDSGKEIKIKEIQEEMFKLGAELYLERFKKK